MKFARQNRRFHARIQQCRFCNARTAFTASHCSQYGHYFDDRHENNPPGFIPRCNRIYSDFVPCCTNCFAIGEEVLRVRDLARQHTRCLKDEEWIEPTWARGLGLCRADQESAVCFADDLIENRATLDERYLEIYVSRPFNLRIGPTDWVELIANEDLIWMGKAPQLIIQWD